MSDLFKAMQQQREALALSDVHIRALLKTTVDAIITIDAEGMVLSFNPAAEKIFGYKAREVIGNKVNMLMPMPHQRDHDKYLKAYRKTHQPRIIGIGREENGLRRNGKTFPIELSISEMQVGERQMFTAIIRDITERKATQRELQEERTFVSAVLNTVGALIIVMDERGRVVRFNRTCQLLTGYTEEETAGKTFWSLMVPQDEMASTRKLFMDLAGGLPARDYEGHLITRDGECRRIAWSHSVLDTEDGTGHYLIATGLDVTEKKMAEEALVSVSENERKLIGQELHDALGQEMTGLTLLTGAMERKLAQGRDVTLEEAASISQLAKTALSQVKTLAHGLYPAELEKHGLSAALKELAENLQRLHHIQCSFQGLDPVPVRSRTRELHLYRIAQEAANNALKHSRATEINILYYSDETMLKLSIEDNGIGIPEDRPTSGMGLNIMRYRATQIDAELSIRRRSRGGTRVECISIRKEISQEETSEETP